MQDQPCCARRSGKQDDDSRRRPSPRFRFCNVDLQPGVACGDDREFLARDKMHILGQAVSPAGHGDDIPILCRLTERFSKHEDIAAEVGLFHKRVGPDHLHQLVFGDYLFAVANQNQKDLKRLWRQRNWLSATQQRLLIGIDPKRPELVKFPGLMAHARGHGAPPSSLSLVGPRSLARIEAQAVSPAIKPRLSKLLFPGYLRDCEKLSEVFRVV